MRLKVIEMMTETIMQFDERCVEHDETELHKLNMAWLQGVHKMLRHENGMPESPTDTLERMRQSIAKEGGNLVEVEGSFDHKTGQVVMKFKGISNEEGQVMATQYFPKMLQEICQARHN